MKVKRTPSILRDDLEYAVHCDEKGMIIGPISKVHAHLPGPRQALTHYRPMDFKETLIKEADEEIGLQIKVVDSLKEFVKYYKSSSLGPIAFVFEKFHYKTEHNNEFVGLAFIITSTTTVEFKDDEVVEFKWLTPKELEKYLKAETNYCHPLLVAFEKAERFRKKYLM